MSKTNITAVDQLYGWEPSAVLSWLDSVWSDKESVPESFSWLRLADYAAHTARYDNDLDWAKVGTCIYDWLQQRDPRLGYDRSSMYLRAYFIEKRGSVNGDSLLDPNVILNWFYNSLPMSLVEAQLGIPECKKTIAKADIKGPDDLQLCRELRLIKNNLNVLWALVETGTLVPDDDLSRWLEIRLF